MILVNNGKRCGAEDKPMIKKKMIRKGDPKAVNGTGRVGYLDERLSENEITEMLGFGPTYRDNGEYSKTTVEWVVEIDGCPLTIYDYKGDRWHIGGHSIAAVGALALGCDLRIDRSEYGNPVLVP